MLQENEKKYMLKENVYCRKGHLYASCISILISYTRIGLFLWCQDECITAKCVYSHD